MTLSYARTRGDDEMSTTEPEPARAQVDGEIRCEVDGQQFQYRSVLEDGPWELMFSHTLILNFTTNVGDGPCESAIWRRIP